MGGISLVIPFHNQV